MKTEKTNTTNVVKEENPTVNAANDKVNVSRLYSNPDFDGSEVMEWNETPFVAMGKFLRINSNELASLIYARFRKTFHDLRGCNIEYTGGTNFAVELFFEKNNEPLAKGEIRNIESLIESASGTFERQQVVNNRISGNTYTINNETKLLLSKFMYGGKSANLPQNNKVWKNHISEVHAKTNIAPWLQRNGYGAENFYVKVTNLNLNYIIQEIYGHEMVVETRSTEAGNDTNRKAACAYVARFIKANGDGTFVMHIDQFDRDAVQKTVVKENPVQIVNGIRMYS